MYGPDQHNQHHTTQAPKAPVPHGWHARPVLPAKTLQEIQQEEAEAARRAHRTQHQHAAMVAPPQAARAAGDDLFWDYGGAQQAVAHAPGQPALQGVWGQGSRMVVAAPPAHAALQQQQQQPRAGAYGKLSDCPSQQSVVA